MTQSPKRPVAIIQARMGSSRLPGKVLREVCGKTLLEWLWIRLKRSRLLGGVALAIPESPENDPLMQWAARAGMPCFRGSEDDVLSRYLAAAKGMDADPVVRITSDCPLIDPGIVDQVIGLYRESGADYASNTIDRTYPRGFDAEAVSRAALEEAGRDARQVFEREHVTPYVWQRPERFRLRSLKASGALVRPDIRICVDTPEDLELIRAVFERLGDGAVDADARGIVAVMEKYPELLDINKHVKQKHT